MIYPVDGTTDEGDAYVPDENLIMPKPPRAFTAEQLAEHARFMAIRWPAIVGQTSQCLAPCHSGQCKGKIKLQYRRGPQQWQCVICGAVNND